MKKRVLVFSVVLTLILGACGSAESQPATTATPQEAESVTNAIETTLLPETTPAQTTAAPETTPEETKSSFSEKDKVLLDNDMAKVTLMDEIESSRYVGYKVAIENKSDKYIHVSVEYGSVDGLMTFINLQGSSLAPGKKANAEMRFAFSNTEVTSLDDLKHVEGLFSISTNTDGGNSYAGNDDRYPFEIIGHADVESTTHETVTGQTLLDNDKLLIVLGDKVEGSNYVGYRLYMENKTDKYIYVGVDNGSVDGYMTYVNMQGSIIAPGKRSHAEMRVSTKNTDVKSLDDLKNIEGSFTISSNSDGTNSFRGGDDHYPFKID